MTIHDALGDYFERRGIKPAGESVDEWLRENWVYMSVFGRRVPVKPLYGYKKVVVLHDVHHVVAGYDTTWAGEFQVAAWELGSGGCGPYLLMWNNRILTLLLGLIFTPVLTWRAFHRGRTQRNLYRFDCRAVLARELDEVRGYVEGRNARFSDADRMAWQAAQRGFVRLAWLLPLTFTLLEAEQWNIVAYYQTHFPGGPAVSVAHARVTQFVAVLIGWLWTRAAMRARSAPRAAFAILPFAAIGLLEALLHAYGAAYFRGYFPGMVVALTVFGPASLLLARRARRDGLVSRAYVVALAVIVLLDFGAWAIRWEGSVTDKMVATERIGAALARLVGH